MIALESLSCSRAPPFDALMLSIAPGELPAVVGADDAERAALVELLAGYRTESTGRFLLDGQPLAPRARRSAVVVLPHKAALTADLTVSEHLRLLVRLRGSRLDDAGQQKILEFAGVDRATRRPGELTPVARLRLTLALSMVGRPALVLALDPQPEVAQLMAELAAPDRALLVVAAQLQGMESQVTRVHSLQEGRLTDGIATATTSSGERAFILRVGQGSVTLENLLGTQGGVSLDKVSHGLYRIWVRHEVAMAPMLRALVLAGVELEAVTPVADAGGAVLRTGKLEVRR